MQTTEAQDTLYGGADLHGNNVVLALCDAGGKAVFKRRVKANLKAVNTAMKPYWPRVAAMAVESTYNWYWFVDGLKEQGRDIRLANPAKIAQYEGIKQTDDLSDAAWLAEMLRLGILPECYVYPKEIRPIRDALRRRQIFVRQRTQSLLSLQAFFARSGLDEPTAAELKSWTEAELDALHLGAFDQLQAASLLESVRQADRLAGRIEREVLAVANPVADFQTIQQIPGVGPILGLTILLESGSFARFPSAGHFASYCRAVPSERQSNGKKKGQNNRKNGNAYLGWAFIEAVAHAIVHYPRIRAWYDRKKRRRGSSVAFKALAAKLAKATWLVMQGKVYNERMLFG